MTVEEFGHRWRAGEVTALEVTNACLARIDRDNPKLNAFILASHDEARAQAHEADRERDLGRTRGPLHGVPISIKDLFDVAHQPTTAASRVRQGHVAAGDSDAITALRRAGAVLIGKTNLHEFALGTTNEESAYGPVLNPYDHARGSGGSSGGSAVSVAAGMALATLGTDTGGSIRIPASACGIVGLKPTYGELSTNGVVPLSHTLDHVGPLAQTVSDAWLVYHALRGSSASAGTLDAIDVSGLRLGLPRAYFMDVLDHDVRAVFESSIAALTKAGAIVEEVTITGAQLTPAVYVHIVFGDAAPYHAPALEKMPERYTEPVRLRLEMARYVLAEDYVRAMEGREALRRAVDLALSGYDALILPTLPIPAPPLGAATVNMEGRTEPVRNVMLRLTQLFNITGHPALSLPNGKTSTQLPTGLQLVGAYGATDGLLRVGRAVERVLQEKGPA